jgi:type I restriction enzyme M protein
MITGSIRSQIDQIWNTFWSGGISNPLEVIEQITYLLFLRRLDDLHTLEENKANRLRKPMLQQLFGHRMAAMGRVAAAMHGELRGFDDLFDSLQHRAFRGEL